MHLNCTGSFFTSNFEVTGSFVFEIQLGLIHFTILSTISGSSTWYLSATSKSLIILIVAPVEIKDILSNSFSSSSLFSILTISFCPSALLGTFMAMVTTSLYAPFIPSILSTFIACPANMRSMTVPLRMGRTLNSFSALIPPPPLQW